MNFENFLKLNKNSLDVLNSWKKLVPEPGIHEPKLVSPWTKLFGELDCGPGQFDRDDNSKSVPARTDIGNFLGNEAIFTEPLERLSRI